VIDCGVMVGLVVYQRLDLGVLVGLRWKKLMIG
jgi:hypothetical protein